MEQRISKHISYKELIYSHTAKRRGIRNTPNRQQIENAKALASFIFEPLRKWVGGAVKINSFFRSAALNVAVGGSSTSQHCKAEAIDIDDIYGYKTNAEMFWYIVENLDFDQIIWEFGNSKNPDWVHVSFKRNGKNRGKLLKAVRRAGRASYISMKRR